MPELRKDYFLDRWVIIATDRAKRPHEFQHPTVSQKKETVCAFCAGNEHLTPGEISRVERNGKWTIRVIPNKYPAVKLQGDATIKTHNEFYTFADAYGSHEIIIETPDHKKQLWDLSINDTEALLRVYHERVQELTKNKNINYVQIFKNHDTPAGTSITHSHSQIIGYNTIPKTIRDEHDATLRYPTCPYCSVIQREKDSDRRCFENATMIAFAPYASRFPFEMLLLPKKHATHFNQIDSLRDVASILQQTLGKLRTLNAPYNLVLHYSPYENNLHFHIEVLPRLTIWAGFEYSGTIINPMPPEDAAKYYRGA